MTDTTTSISWSPKMIKVVCHVAELYADADDTDDIPDLKTIGGSVTFSTQVRLIKVTDPETNITRLVSRFGEEYKINPTTGELVDEEGRPGVYLLDPTDPNVQPNGFTYTATIKFGKVTHRVTFGGGSDVVDLAKIVSVAAFSGVTTIVSTDSLIEAQEHARQAKLSEIKASETLENLKTKIESGDFQGVSIADVIDNGDNSISIKLSDGKIFGPFNLPAAQGITSIRIYGDQLMIEVGNTTWQMSMPPAPPGHSPELSWSGDQISIDGKLGPHLTGPKGDAGAGNNIIYGPGRPDIPETTEGAIDIDATYPSGTVFVSTNEQDGASIWTSMPRGTDSTPPEWTVTRGFVDIPNMVIYHADDYTLGMMQLSAQKNPSITSLDIQFVFTIPELLKFVQNGGSDWLPPGWDFSRFPRTVPVLLDIKIFNEESVPIESRTLTGTLRVGSKVNLYTDLEVLYTLNQTSYAVSNISGKASITSPTNLDTLWPYWG